VRSDIICKGRNRRSLSSGQLVRIVRATSVWFVKSLSLHLPPRFFVAKSTYVVSNHCIPHNLNTIIPASCFLIPFVIPLHSSLNNFPTPHTPFGKQSLHRHMSQTSKKTTVFQAGNQAKKQHYKSRQTIYCGCICGRSLDARELLSSLQLADPRRIGDYYSIGDGSYWWFVMAWRGLKVLVSVCLWRCGDGDRDELAFSYRGESV
jgi:hypothetical protein